MYNFEKKLISIAYYLHSHGALGYWEAVALMRYYFDWHHENQNNIKKALQ